MEVCGGHVVPLLTTGGEILDGREEMVQEIEGRLASMAAADVLDAIDSKLLVMNVTSVAEAIRKKEKESPGSSCRESSSYVAIEKRPGGRPAI